MKKKIAFIILSGFLGMQTSQASVVISGARVIFSEKEKEITVKLNNPKNKSPALIQSWIEPAESSPAGQVPFVLTPPLSRLEPGQGMSLRLIYTGEVLPKDRESLFYLNVLDMPPKKKPDGTTSGNYLQLAIQNKLKLFFRPAGLLSAVKDAPGNTAWRIVNQSNNYYLVGKNSSPYHITYSRLSVTANGKTYRIAQPGMLLPFNEGRYQLTDMKTMPSGRINIHYETINDYGANYKGESSVSL